MVKVQAVQVKAADLEGEDHRVTLGRVEIGLALRQIPQVVAAATLRPVKTASIRRHPAAKRGPIHVKQRCIKRLR